MRQCGKCGIEKDLSEFYFKKRSEGVKHTTCKSCQKIYRDKHYKENKQLYFKKAKEWDKKYRARNKEIVDTFKLIRGCQNCPENDPVVLDCHHTRDKVCAVSDMVRYGYSIERLNEELDKCIVLCANCHRRLHAQGL